MTRTTASLAVLAALTACADGVSSPAVVQGTVRYEGRVAGPLRVALFASFPPRGAPVAEVAIEEPRYPQPYSIAGVVPGRYFVLAIVDADPGDGDRYRPAVDAGGAFGSYDRPAAVTIDLSGVGGIDLTLADPFPGSPWSYGP